MRDRVPLWVGIALAVGGWLTGRLAGAATGSIDAVLGCSLLVSAGGAAIAWRTWRPLYERQRRFRDLTEILTGARKGSPRGAGFHFAPGERSWVMPSRMALLGCILLVFVVYALTAPIPWPDEPSWGTTSATEVLALIAVIPIYPVLFQALDAYARKRHFAAQRRRRAKIESAMRKIRATASGDQATVVMDWRWPVLCVIAVVALASAAATVPATLAAPSDPSLVNVLLPLLAALVAVLLTVGLVPAIRHSTEAMRLDSRGVDIAGRGAIPWEAVNCEVIPGILGSMLVVIPEGDDASIDAAPWMTPRLRRYLRSRNYLNTMQLLVVRTSPAALIVAIETCGGRVTRIE